MTKNLTVGRPVRLIVLFTLPLLVGNLFQQLYSVTDAMVVGRLLGVDALAAVGASGSLQFLLLGFAMGASAGLGIPVAKAFGAGDLVAMRRSVAAGIIVSAAITVGIVLAGTLGSHYLLTLMGTPPELMDGASTFLRVLFSGAAATVAFNFLSAIIRALGDSRTPLLFLVVACLLNAALVVVFVAVLHLGVGGAAAATVTAQAVSVVLCLVLIQRRMPMLKLTRADWRLPQGLLPKNAWLAVTMGFQMSVIAIGAAVLQYGINQLGADAVAAFTAAMRVDQAAVAPLASIGVAMSTYVAQNRGAGQWYRIRVGIFRTGLLAMGLAVVLGGLILVFGTSLARLFFSDGNDEVVAMAHRYLVINGALYAVLAVLFLLRNSMQGLGATTVPTIAGIAELVARAAVGLFLIDRIGFLGACVAAPLAWVAALIPLAVAWYFERRKLIERESGVVAVHATEASALQPAGA
jgi:putative MATE family efflux protein